VRLTLINTIPLWGGGELWTLDTALALRERGHDVVVMAVEGGALLDRVRDAGLETLCLPRSIWKQRGFIRSFRLREQGAPSDVLLGFSGRDARLAARLSGGSGRTLIALSRQLDQPLKNSVLRRIGFRNLDLIIANSDATGRTMATSLPWFPPENIVRVYNAFDAGAFRTYEPRPIREELGIPGNAYLIGLFGRLTPQKGHVVMFEAMPRILEAVPEAELLIVGGGDLEQELRSLAGKLGIQGACRFIGHVDRVQPYMAATDVVVIPSWFEGFCFGAVEAQALEKPVVASRASSLVEVIQDGESGVLVRAGDSAAFAKEVIRLAGDEPSRRKMGLAGREYVKRFSASATYDLLSRILEERSLNKAR
jgi:glycosyltransferase involved in cell wall biosynthesis